MNQPTIEEYVEAACKPLEQDIEQLEASNLQLAEALTELAEGAPWGGEIDTFEPYIRNFAEQALKSAPLERYQAMDKAIKAAQMFKRSNLAKDLVALHGATANFNRITAKEDECI